MDSAAKTNTKNAPVEGADMQQHTYSKEGLALTRGFEGLQLTAYQDVAGVWTIGYGHTGPDVTPELTISELQAEALLLSDLAAAIRCVNQAVTVDLAQCQFDALVDFAFNLGGVQRRARDDSVGQLGFGDPI